VTSGLRHRSARKGPVAWLTRGFAASLLTLAGMAGIAANAGSASAGTPAPTINCDTAAQPSANWTLCQKLVGTAKCVWNNHDGTYTLAVGYTNPTADILTAAIPDTATNTAGTNNAFTATDGSAANPGHASTFFIGTFTTAWTVTWTPASKTDLVSWALMGHTFTWADTYTACPSKPVPVISTGIGGATGLVAITGLGFMTRRRFRGLLSATRLVAAPTA
jgi:hypothetical protein